MIPHRGLTRKARARVSCHCRLICVCARVCQSCGSSVINSTRGILHKSAPFDPAPSTSIAVSARARVRAPLRRHKRIVLPPSEEETAASRCKVAESKEERGSFDQL